MRERILDIVYRACGNSSVLKNMDTDLFETNILDSLAFVDMLVLFEDELDIVIQPTQVSVSTWQTPGSIVEYVQSLTDKF